MSLQPLRTITPPFQCMRRLYSAATHPLIRVTNLPAPGTGHIRILELNRPGAHNAISKALLAALSKEVAAIQNQYGSEGEELYTSDSPVRALILASAIDSSFCAGADLKERRGFTPEETVAFLADLRGAFSSLSSLPIPTISAISSFALGGGLELALSTHFRILSSNATVSLPESRLGIIPGAGGTFRLPAIIGLSRARDLIVTGRRVAAPEAYFMGIADRLVEIGSESDDRTNGLDILSKARRAVLAEAVNLAKEICEGGPIGVRMGLKAVTYARKQEDENEIYEQVINTEDRNEALSAFQEKRKPVFRGR